jgi:Bacterial SH3 domain
MNRLLILLFMVGWAFYIVQMKSGPTGYAVQSEQSAKATEQATTDQKVVKQSEIQPIARAAVHSPHAIIPDEPPQKGAVSSEAPPPPRPAENSEQPSSSQSATAEPPFEPGEKLRVTAQTSIRSGPSETATVIGTAHAGAKLRVKSSETGWVQFIDPAAKKSGWISMAYLAPAERENEFESIASAQAEQPQSNPAARPKQPPKTAKPKPPKPAPKVSQLPPTYAELPADREFVPPRRGGLFGLFWKRRLTAEQFFHRPSP